MVRLVFVWTLCHSVIKCYRAFIRETSTYANCDSKSGQGCCTYNRSDIPYVVENTNDVVELIHFEINPAFCNFSRSINTMRTLWLGVIPFMLASCSDKPETVTPVQSTSPTTTAAQNKPSDSTNPLLYGIMGFMLGHSMPSPASAPPVTQSYSSSVTPPRSAVQPSPVPATPQSQYQSVPKSPTYNAPLVSNRAPTTYSAPSRPSSSPSSSSGRR